MLFLLLTKTNKIIMEKIELDSKGARNELPSEPAGVLNQQQDVKKERRPLTKKDGELQDLLFNNEMDRVRTIKRFVSSVLEKSGDIDGTTAVYFQEPNGFRVELFKSFVQSTMDNKKFLPAGKSVDLEDYKKIAEILKQSENINVEQVNEHGVYGTVLMFSKDTYVSSNLGINPEDSEMESKKILSYMTGEDKQQENKNKIASLKQSIYSLFKKDK